MHRHVETQRLGSLEVDDKLILRRCLHRHVGWLLALEDAIDVCRGPSILVRQIESVRNEAASTGEKTVRVDRRQTMSRRQRDEEVAMAQADGVRDHDESDVWLLYEGPDRPLDLDGITHADRRHLQPE